jgi:outer membrane PBP1 activator LpoA protein
MADGAQMILGPLGRDEVAVIFNQSGVDIPVIALNRGAVPPTPGNASFALSPEEEGLVAADHLADRGVMKVFAISQHDESAQRILGAFREQLRARGGEIVGEMSINDGTADIAASFQQALAGAKSPPNSVFLALRASQARLAAGQIRISPLAAVPRVSSSLILSGGSNTKLDTVLDGIELPVLPWLVDQRPSLPRPEELAKTLPSARGAAQPLFAFGMDAWQLAVYFDRLSSDPSFAVSGATGELRLDNSGIVQREPAWAVFSSGRPHAVAPPPR